MKLAEAPPVSNDESTNIVPKETSDVVVMERDASPAGIKRPTRSVLEETPAGTQRATISESSYAQERAAIKELFVPRNWNDGRTARTRKASCG